MGQKFVLAVATILFVAGCASKPYGTCKQTSKPQADIPQYTFELKTAPMHEESHPDEEHESKLIVTETHPGQNPVQKVYGFMMGCQLVADFKKAGQIILDCPSDMAGIQVAYSLIKVALKDGSSEVLVDHIVHQFESLSTKDTFLVGVSRPKDITVKTENEKQLFILRVNSQTGKTDKSILLVDPRLPDDWDLEFKSESATKKMEAKWATLTQFQENTLLYRASPSQKFRQLNLDAPF